MKATVVITEKKNISRVIARALAPDGFDDRGNSNYLHCDIISLRTMQQRGTEQRFGSIGTLDDIGCCVRDSFLEEKERSANNFYFCQTDCMSCQFEAQHVDRMGKKSASRVRKKVKYINEHIISDFQRPVLEILRQRGNMSLNDLRDAVLESEAGPQDMLDFQTESLEGALMRTVETLARPGLIKRENGEIFLTDKGCGALGKGNGDAVITEDIEYFAIPYNGGVVYIVDSYGTPFNTYSTQRNFGDFITRVKSWGEVRKRLNLVPSKETRDPKDLKAHSARARLFNHLLAKQRSPCNVNGISAGERFDLERIIAGTDFDIAGSNIFMSVIEYANGFISRNSNGQEQIPMIKDDILFRMKLQNLDLETIRKEFNEPLGFDWENAYAGKTREVFDYLYGAVISEQFRMAKSRAEVPRYARMSVGRNLFLGLKKLVEQQEVVVRADDENYLYIAFDGLKDLEGIRKDMANGNFAALQVKQRLTNVSQARFLELCEKDNIGTHTTRYKLPQKLVAQGQACMGETEIVATPYGMFYYEVTKTLLDSLFSIDNWNQRLYSAINNWRSDHEGKKARSHEEMEAEFNDFMNFFIPVYARHLSSIKTKYPSLVRALWNAQQTLPKVTYYKGKERKTKAEPYMIVGRDGVIARGDVGAFVVSDVNSLRYNQPSGFCPDIVRVDKRKTKTIEDNVRRVLKIDREYDFFVQYCVNLQNLIGFRNEIHTVFRAP
ncbi:hypothetical protein JXC34_06235, partial [Candidatus Woesearchaeota archaeon]|nr:hypothetical protein [Candidatus Woesearchaeota archaeon]